MFLSSFIRLPPPLRAFWESSFKYQSTVQLTEILYNTYSFLYFCRWARILRQSIWAFLHHASSNQVCLPVFEPTFVPLRYIIFFLLWYSSVFPYLYFTVSLISVYFKWLSNTYLTGSSTAVTRYCGWFLTYTVIYDGRFRLTQVIEGNT